MACLPCRLPTGLGLQSTGKVRRLPPHRRPQHSVIALDGTGDDVDFRGFEPAFALIDSDVVAFLERSLEHGALNWSVIGAHGRRTIDVLIFEQRQIPGIYYVYVCSAPTGRLTAAWLRSRDPPCLPDSAAFAAVSALAWALIEHLLGTLWMFDLYGWGSLPEVGP